MSHLQCPACGAEMSLDVALANEALRRATVELISMGLPLGSLVLRYVGLFRPVKNRLSPDRMAKLIAQLLPDMQRSAITHKGREWAAPLASWRAGLESMLEKAAADKLSLPLDNHNYLYAVLVGLADKAEATDERQAEHDRRSREHQAGAISISDAIAGAGALPQAVAGTPITSTSAPRVESPTVRRMKAEIAGRKSPATEGATS